MNRDINMENTRIIDKRGLWAQPFRHTFQEILDKGYCPIRELRERYCEYEFKGTCDAVDCLTGLYKENFKEALRSQMKYSYTEITQVIRELDEMDDLEFYDGYGEDAPEEDEEPLEGEENYPED